MHQSAPTNTDTMQLQKLTPVLAQYLYVKFYALIT